MVQHVAQLLRRYRTVKPFPLRVQKFIETVYPQEMFTPHKDRGTTARWDNLMAAANMGLQPHFLIEGRNDTETFWVRLADDSSFVPIPLDVSKPLVFFKENPHFDAVNDWVTEALEIHHEINMCLETCKSFIREATHPVHIGKLWPELRSFVGEVPAHLTQYLDEINPNTILVVPPRIRTRITTLLAKCVLLPEEVCNAWVQFPEGD